MEYFLEEKILNIRIDSLPYKTIQDFMDAYTPSSKIQHLLIQNKWLKIDNIPVKRESEITGEYINIEIYPYNNDYQKLPYNIEVIYEDEFLVIVNKPKGLLVHSDGGQEISLSDYVKSYYSCRPYIDVTPIHRLDKETTGLVVFSKSKIFQPLFDKLLTQKKIRRKYLAFCEGDFKKETEVIDLPIGKDRHNSNKHIVYSKGQEAITKIIKIASRNNISILRCILETGRTHQIRVHLSHIGYPILNDSLYGIKSNKIIRMGLIADELEFYHPIKEDNINIEVNLPNDMSKLYSEVCK